MKNKLKESEIIKQYGIGRSRTALESQLGEYNEEELKQAYSEYLSNMCCDGYPIKPDKFSRVKYIKDLFVSCFRRNN